MPDMPSVMIVEDEPLIALSLTMAVEDAGGDVVGPFATVADALAALGHERVTAAVIDANLLDRDATPVAMLLIEKALPFVVHSGTGLPAELAAVHPDLPLIMKPASSDSVVARLMQEAAMPVAARHRSV